MSLKKVATYGLVWTYTQQFGNQLVGFLVSLVLARILLPEEFGLIGMIAVFVAIGNALLDGGLTKSLIRDNDIDQEDYSTVFYFQLIASICVYLLIFFLAPFISDFFEEKLLTSIIRVYCLTFIVTSFSAIQSARFTKFMNFKSQTIIAIPAAIIGGLIGVIMALNNFGVWSLVWSSLVSSSVNAVLLWKYAKWTPDLLFNFQKFKKHFNYGYKLTLSDLLNRIFNNIFLIVIGKYFSAAQVGFYTRAETMKQLPVTNISNALNKVMFPLFVSIQDDNVRLRRVYKKLMHMVLFVITPLLIILAVLAEPTFRFLYTAKWLPAVPYFQVLCLSGILYPLHSYNLTILNVKGRSDLFLKLEVYKKIIIVIVIIFTIPFGIMALLYGQILISILSFFINAQYTEEFISYSSLQQLRDVLPIFLLSFSTGFLVYLLDILVLESNYDLIRISLGGLAGTLFYLSVAHLLRFGSFAELVKLFKKKSLL